MAYKCQTCGEIHDDVPMDVAFGKPADYFAVPAEERDARCLLTEDWCVIDESRFFIRGCLRVPVTDSPMPFVWGIWAEVDLRSFQRYYELYSTDGSREPPFNGRLSGESHGYEGLDRHPVTIQLKTVKERPEFTLLPSNNLLFLEQRQGITIHRVHEILNKLFPGQFGERDVE